MEVVHLDDVLLGDERAPDRVGVGVPRRPLEKDRASTRAGAATLDQSISAGDGEAGDRVEAVPARGEDEPAGERRGAESGDVCQRRGETHRAR